MNNEPIKLSLKDICRTCQGQRTLLALGNLRKLCTNCHGSGYIDHIAAPVPTALIEQNKKLVKRTQSVRSKLNRDIARGNIPQIKPEPELII